MGIWNRLSGMIKSYLNDEDSRIFGHREQRRFSSEDPDLDAAFEELNDFLKGGGADDAFRREGARGNGDWTDKAWTEGRAWTGKGGWTRGNARTGASDTGRARPSLPPEELRPDFAELGLPFGASAEECKAAYKKLLKIHHPDRHAGHEGNFKKATEKTARMNAAYDRIEKWREGR
jgi:hypothetical protein